MRSKFRERTSGLASDLDDGSVDEYLNRAYQYTVPLDVGGEFGEQLWELECVVGQTEYPQPTPMVGVTTATPWIDEYVDGLSQRQPTSQRDIGVDTFAHVFKRRYRTSEYDVPGQPTAILVYGKTVTVNRPPDIKYIITIPVRSGPLTALTSDGVAHEIHALAVVTASAQEFLTDSEDQLGASREAEAYKRYERQLHTFAQARPNLRRRKRSF